MDSDKIIIVTVFDTRQHPFKLFEDVKNELGSHLLECIRDLELAKFCRFEKVEILFMDLEEKRIAIIEKIQMLDEGTLDAILELMDSRQAITDPVLIRRLTIEIDRAEADIAAGRVYSEEEADRIMDSW